MNKLEALIITGKFEIRFQGKEQLLDEIVNLQKFIIENDLDNQAIILGRISELIKDFETDVVSKDIKSLYDFIFERSKVEQLEVSMAKENLDLLIEELMLTPRQFNDLKQIDINTVRDIVMMDNAREKLIKTLGKKSFDEVIVKLKEIGIVLS